MTLEILITLTTYPTKHPCRFQLKNMTIDIAPFSLFLKPGEKNCNTKKKIPTQHDCDLVVNKWEF